jgi:hypothetical protein
MQNWFATFALLSWPLVALGLYLTQPQSKAILWAILGAQLLLPVGAVIKFEMIPQFDKSSIPNLCVLIGCLIVAGRPVRIFSGRGIAEILILMFLVAPIITSLLNGDTIVIGDRLLPAVGIYDAVSAVEAAFILLIPFFVGRQFLRTAGSNGEILRILVSAGLVYSIPLLFEMRFSPQLHYWFYGYYPSEFIQSIRGGGYRPMVFMGHGLLAAIFMMMAVVASAALWRARIRVHKLPSSGVTAYLGVILILCKSLGAAVYGVVLVPLVRLAKPEFQMRIAVAFVLIALIYPMSRSLQLFPTGFILQTAKLFSDDRFGSMAYRFENEDQLLVRAFERPLFGWGRFGRNRIYDADTGRDSSVTDGRWIITFGQFGFFGFIAEFGLLTMGVFRAALAMRYTGSPRDKIYLSALSLIVAINILDLLPNSSLLPLTWLLSGSLLGRAEALHAMATRKPRLNRLIGAHRPKPIAVD